VQTIFSDTSILRLLNVEAGRAQHREATRHFLADPAAGVREKKAAPCGAA
jgi:hypothetical protein